VKTKDDDKLDRAIKKLRGDLDWRGPNDRIAGVVVLQRDLAQVLLDWIDKQREPKP